MSEPICAKCGWKGSRVMIYMHCPVAKCRHYYPKCVEGCWCGGLDI